ncbi:MAG: amidase domain-containing protein [Desulfotomaculum sp.]|nr:amidase domain-containing protein [Desulfotomaculum sp.]
MFKKINIYGQFALIMIFSVVFIVTLILPGFAATKTTIEGISQESAITLNNLEQAVKEYIEQDNTQRNWNIKSQKITLISSGQEENKTFAVFDVYRQFTLNYNSPEEVPILKGKLRWYEENKKQLSAMQSKEIQEDISMWQSDLAEYINKPQDAYERLKVAITKEKDGQISNPTIFGEDPLGKYILLENVVPMPQKVEQESYKSMEKNISQITETYSTNAIIAPYNQYNRIVARDYANRWTSNTTRPCRPGSTTTQDPLFYNAAFCWYQCNDCANYVSQALNAGGIPMDSTWWENRNSSSYAWCNVSGLRSYMLNTKKYLQVVSRWQCVAGFPFRMTSYPHIMLMVHNDGQTQLYSGHTSDRKQRIWHGGGNVEYFRVIF